MDVLIIWKAATTKVSTHIYFYINVKIKKIFNLTFEKPGILKNLTIRKRNWTEEKNLSIYLYLQKFIKKKYLYL